MKSLAVKSYDKMWDSLEKRISQLSADRYSADLPGIKLFAAIIFRAARDGNFEYIKTEQFDYYVLMLKLSPSFVQSVIKKGWKYIQSGQVWVETLPDNITL